MEALINFLLQSGHLNRQQIDLIKSKTVLKSLKKAHIGATFSCRESPATSREKLSTKSQAMQLPPPFAIGEKDLINVVIETPKGSRNKFSFDEASWLFELKKILPAGTVFPLDFGFVPGTKAEDGDPLDVLVVMEQSTYPGCLLRCRPIGIIEAEQTERDGKKERNDRILAVPDVSAEHARLRDIKDFPEEHLRNLTHFFIYYNEMAGKQFRLLGTKGPEAALAAVKKAML